MINSIPEKYYQGVKIIKIYNPPNTKDTGYYYKSGVIIIYGDCEFKDVLVHEVAHNVQVMRGEKSFYLPHDTNFWNIYKEIANDSKVY